jgi:hypothetical protein
MTEIKIGVHMSHCNQGENLGSCAYGYDNCPALNVRETSHSFEYDSGRIKVYKPENYHYGDQRKYARNATVNWASIGEVTPEEARKFALLILKAADKADSLNRTDEQQESEYNILKQDLADD